MIELTYFVKNVEFVTKADLEKNHSPDSLFRDLVEEVGEFAAAKTIEKGVKKKYLKESSKVEAVDVIICALAVFFETGGTVEELSSIGMEKLKKWQERIK